MTLRGWPHLQSPFHPGEQAAQARSGSRLRAEVLGRRIIREFLPEPHRELFQKLPLVFVGSLDGEGSPRASVLVGPPGFARAPDERSLRIEARALAGDPLADTLVLGAPLGVLAIQPSTRRRNRANGRVTSVDERSFTIRVEQSFGNCQKYIQAREPVFTRDLRAPAASAVATFGRELPDAAADLIRRSDTFFIATASPGARSGELTHGVDVSHRGGRPGFVAVERDAAGAVLVFPDYSGNSAFNTIGNLELEPRAGLLFLDFESGDLVSMAGEATVIWDGPQVSRFPDAERVLTFRVRRGFRSPAAVPLRWSPATFARELR